MSDRHMTAEERLKRLRVIAGSSIVGDDLKWLLEEYDRLQIDNRALADTAAHALGCEGPDDVGWWSYVRHSVSQEKLEGSYAPTHWMPLPEPPREAS